MRSASCPVPRRTVPIFLGIEARSRRETQAPLGPREPDDPQRGPTQPAQRPLPKTNWSDPFPFFEDNAFLPFPCKIHEPVAVSQNDDD
jgi:hypothetical protein